MCCIRQEHQIEKKLKKKQKKQEKLAAEELKRQQEAERAAAARKRSKRLRKKRDESDDGVEPKAKKPKEKKIPTVSGSFTEEPVTPPRVQYGFVEEPMTHTPKGIVVENISPDIAQPAQKSKKRRLAPENKSSALLPKPVWIVDQLFDEFEQTHSNKRQRTSNEIHIYNAGPTKFIVKQLDGHKRRKQPASSLIPAELMEFRKKNLYRKGIPRQDARALLKQKEKMAASKRSWLFGTWHIFSFFINFSSSEINLLDIYILYLPYYLIDYVYVVISTFRWPIILY